MLKKSAKATDPKRISDAEFNKKYRESVPDPDSFISSGLVTKK